MRSSKAVQRVSTRSWHRLAQGQIAIWCDRWRFASSTGDYAFSSPRRQSLGSDISKLLPRSIYILEGEARTMWEHNIPPLDALRYALTFRTLAEDFTLR
jgi:hypothetical protein